MSKPLIAARMDDRTLWVWDYVKGKEDDAKAQITIGDQKPDVAKAKSFLGVTAHMQWDEWDWEPWKKKSDFQSVLKSDGRN